MKMAAGDIGELLVPHMPTIRVPRSGDRVYKNECAFSYDSPVSETRRQDGASGEVAVPAAFGGRESPNSAAREARGEEDARWQPGTRSSGRRSWLRGTAVRQTLKECLLGARRRWIPQGCCSRSPGRPGSFAPPAFLGCQDPNAEQRFQSPATV